MLCRALTFCPLRYTAMSAAASRALRARLTLPPDDRDVRCSLLATVELPPSAMGSWEARYPVYASRLRAREQQLGMRGPFDAFCRTALPAHLVELDLARNRLHANHLEALSRLCAFPCLESLSLEGNHPEWPGGGCEAAGALLRRCPELRRLDLSDCGWPNAGWSAVADAVASLAHLAELRVAGRFAHDMTCSNLTPEGCSVLLQRLARSVRLRTLDISNNLLGGQECEELFGMRQLLTLDAHNCMMGLLENQQARALRAAVGLITAHPMQALDLRGNFASGGARRHLLGAAGKWLRV